RHGPVRCIPERGPDRQAEPPAHVGPAAPAGPSSGDDEEDPMPREYSATEKRNLESVSRLFAPPPGFDVTTLFADDAVWWNGLTRLRGEGSCEHRGIEAIRALVTGSSRDLSRLGVDAYDLATVRNEDVLVLADGDYVVRQHT